MIKAMKIAADIDWERLPGFVDATTEFVFRLNIDGLEVICETAEDVMEMIGQLQGRYDCAAQRIRKSVESRQAVAAVDPAATSTGKLSTRDKSFVQPSDVKRGE